MEMYVTSERGEERHHAICDHCGKTVYPNHNNDNLFFGFKCQDTKMFVSFDCQTDFYNKKNAGEYGVQHAHKYSEFPVMVPWVNKPKYPALIEELITDTKKPWQLALF